MQFRAPELPDYVIEFMQMFAAEIDKKEPSPPQNEKLKQLGHLEEGLRKVIAENGEALKREPSIAGPLQKVSEQATQLDKEKSEGQSGH